MQHLSKPLLAIGLFVVFVVSHAASYKTHHYRVNNPGRWTVDATYPVFSDAGPLGALANQTLAGDIQHAKSFVKQAAEFQKGEAKPDEAYPYTSKFTVPMMRSDLIVVCVSDDQYLGGAHGGQSNRFYCFGYVNGLAKRLQLRDLFSTGVNARSTVSRLVISKLKSNPDAAWVQEGTVKELDAANAEQFAVTRNGLQFTFDPYVMGPYAVGFVSTTIRFDEIRRSLNPNGPLKGLLGSR